jgi:hypothetical protein
MFVRRKAKYIEYQEEKCLNVRVLNIVLYQFIYNLQKILEVNS